MCLREQSTDDCFVELCFTVFHDAGACGVAEELIKNLVFPTWPALLFFK